MIGEPIEEHFQAEWLERDKEKFEAFKLLPLDQKLEETIDNFFLYTHHYLNQESDIDELIYFFHGMSYMWGLDFYQGLTNNIEKLQKRFPEKFTEEAANNRDLEAEKSVLGKDISTDGKA